MSKGKIIVASFQSLSAQSGQGMARLGFHLSKELHQRGFLEKFVVHSKGKFETSFPSVAVSPSARYYLFLLNNLNKVFKFKPYKLRFLQEKLFDHFCAQHLTKDTKLLFVTFPFLKKTITKAKQLGIKTVLLSGTPEENFIYDIVMPENKRMSIDTLDAYTYPARLQYFNDTVPLIDMVIGSLPPAYSSYKTSKAFKGELVKLTGHMPPDFKEVEVTPKDAHKKELVVGYIAYTVVLKGLQYLLEAWKELIGDNNNAHLTLLIGGGMDEQTRLYIDEHYKDIPQVKYLGHISNVGQFMESLDLFVVPSLIDGAPVTALEAAHYEVPVLITENSGSAELLSRGDSGCMIIPIKDAAAIKDRILWSDKNREELIQMGKNAKKNLLANDFPQFIRDIADLLTKEIAQ